MRLMWACIAALIGTVSPASAEVYNWTFNGSYACGGGPGCRPTILPTAIFWTASGTLTTAGVADDAGSFDIVAVTGSWQGKPNLGGVTGGTIVGFGDSSAGVAI